MEQAPRKRGWPKVFLTKEKIEERKLLKRLCKNTRRNLQDNFHCSRSEGEGPSSAQRYTGELPQGGDEGAGLNKDGGNGALDERLGGSDAMGSKSTGETPPPEPATSTLDENGGNAASDDNLGSPAGERPNSTG